MARERADASRRTRGPFVAGGAFAIAWTACVGPTLSAILSAASLSDSAGHAAVLLSAYSAGLAVPFLLTAVAFTRMTGAFAIVRRHHGARWPPAGDPRGHACPHLDGRDRALNIEAQRLLDRVGLDVFTGA